MADHSIKSPRTGKKLRRSRSITELQDRLWDLFDEALVLQQDCLAPPSGASEEQLQTLREVGVQLRPFERFVNVGNQGARSMVAAVERVSGQGSAGHKA